MFKILKLALISLLEAGVSTVARIKKYGILRVDG